MEIMNARRRQFRELHRSDHGDYVQIDVLAILRHRAALQTVRLADGEPCRRRLCDRWRDAVGSVYAGRDLDLASRGESVRLFFQAESFKPSLPCPVDIIDNPRFSRVTVWRRPCPFSDRHDAIIADRGKGSTRKRPVDISPNIGHANQGAAPAETLPK